MNTAKKIISFICALAILLSACENSNSALTPLPATATIRPSATQIPTSTSTATSTQSPTNRPTFTPEILSGYPTVVATPEIPDDFPQEVENFYRNDFTFHDLYVGKYVLRKWCDEEDEKIFRGNICAITISTLNMEPVEIWWLPAKLGKETGADLTGNGIPDIVLIRDDGPYVNTIIYEADDSLTKLLDIWTRPAGYFEDLNDDGTYEFITPIRVWSDVCAICQIWTPIVYEYRLNLGYVPSSTLTSDMVSFTGYEESLAEFSKINPDVDLIFYQSLRDGEKSLEEIKYQQYEEDIEGYGAVVNHLYNLTILYILTGRDQDAKNLLNQHFPPEKAEEYYLLCREEIGYYLFP